MKPNMILSASGWRKVFAVSGDEQDKAPQISEQDKAICIAAASVFFDYISALTNQEVPVLELELTPDQQALLWQMLCCMHLLQKAL